MPPLIKFSFTELPLPEDYDCPLERYSMTVANESYQTRLYLPNHIFLITFEFDCSNSDQIDALPKVTSGQRITKEDIELKIETKQFLHRTKIERHPVRRVTTESILLIADLSLVEYLKSHGKGVKNVAEFLALYEPAEKAFCRDLLTHQSDAVYENRMSL